MGAFEKLVDSIDANPKSVAVALLGVIAAGGIGGGLYINALKMSVDQARSQISAQIQIVAERDAARSEMALRRTRLLEEQVRLLRSGLATVRNYVEAVAQSSGGVAPRSMQPEFKSLASHLDSIQWQVATADSLAAILNRVSVPRGVEQQSSARRPSLAWTYSRAFIIGISIVVLLLSGSLAWRLRQKRTNRTVRSPDKHLSDHR
jgi:hypothetical protein